MKLLSHNMLKSCCKGVKTGYPLRILPVQVVVKTVNFEPEFISRMIPKLEWGVLKTAAESVLWRTRASSRNVRKRSSYRLKLSRKRTIHHFKKKDVGHGADLPDKPPDSYESDEVFLKATHHVLMEVEVIEGELECPDTGRKYPVTEGIPNMLLHEDEIQ